MVRKAEQSLFFGSFNEIMLKQNKYFKLVLKIRLSHCHIFFHLEDNVETMLKYLIKL